LSASLPLARIGTKGDCAMTPRSLLFLADLPLLDLTLGQWFLLPALAGAAFLAGWGIQALVVLLGKPLVQRTAVAWDDKFLDILQGPLRFFAALLLFHFLAPLLRLPEETDRDVGILVRSLLIVTATWFVLRLVRLVAKFTESYLKQGITDPSRLRSVHTQVAIPRAILDFVVRILGVALILLQFEVVRSVGVSLLASAGLAGLVIGLAAQRTIANLLAGIQLAVFQPIRIGDIVIVEGEWGWIEEIGLTFVVHKTWDLRRLVLPVSYFLEKPIQNWTLESADLLGTVFLYTDYTVSVPAIREELSRILQSTDLWDGVRQGVQVTNLTDRTVEVRALVSASDGGKLWDLRCLVRERLLTWMQEQGRGALPVSRVEMVPQGPDRKAKA